jgi:hypothetical protein
MARHYFHCEDVLDGKISLPGTEEVYFRHEIYGYRAAGLRKKGLFGT